jgi:hypothetical protein
VVVGRLFNQARTAKLAIDYERKKGGECKAKVGEGTPVRGIAQL